MSAATVSGIIEPLTTKRAIACPTCDRTLGLVDAKGVTMAVLGTFLTDDADTVPGVQRECADMECWCLAGVGKCPYCGSRHWLLEVNLHEGGQDALIAAWEDDPEWVRSWISPAKERADGALWTVHESSTPDGRYFQANIGPMAVPAGMKTYGPNGVSSCGGGGFWQHAAEKFHALQPELQATFRQIRGGENV